MTPIEFGVSRSKVKVTVTFKLGGHTYSTNISCLHDVLDYDVSVVLIRNMWCGK